jgi:hypothetical protein
MGKKEQKFLDWLCSHGITIAYGVIITVALAICMSVMLLAVLFAHWWDSVR